MSASITIPARSFIDAFNAITVLQAWIRPGFLSYVVGSHVEAMRSHAVRLSTEHQGMLAEAAKRHPDVYPDDHTDVSLRGTPHPLAGEMVTAPGPNGQLVTLFKTPEAGAEFRKREAALFDATITIQVDARLTLALFKSLDTERLDAPRSINNMPIPTENVDFSALMVLIERDYAPSGVLESVERASISASENGNRVAASLVP